MNTIRLIIFLFLSLTSVSLIAQSAPEDQELSSVLKELNSSAKAGLEQFKKDLVEDFKIPVEKIDKLINTFKMEPSDVFMTLQVSKQSGKTVDEVAENYKKNKDKGWGAIAKEMGIKPGSKEFHALKDEAKGKSKKMNEEKEGKGKGNKGKDKEKGSKGNGNSKGKGKNK